MTDESCTCPREWKSLGRLDRVNMGKGWVRMSTTKDCPVHDSCQHYTIKDRNERPVWSDPWCPIHKNTPCPS